jgi:hypothetical protein
MTRNDRSYRQFFSHPRMVLSLLRLLGRKVTGPLDFTSLERAQDSFVSERHAARQGDLLWRLRRPDGRPVYLLLEFQSRSERLMSLRVLGYVTLIAQDLAAQGALLADGPDVKVPEILPVVVYTGDRRWSAPLEVRRVLTGAGRHVPLMCFLLVDQGSYSGQRLRRLPGPVGALFLLERHRTPRDLEHGLQLLVARLRDEDAPLRRAFVVWLERVLLPGRTFPDQEMPDLSDLQELKSMLETRVRQWNRQLRAEGRREGRMEGRGDGEAAVLLRQLETKFGPLDEAVRTRIREATSAQRLAWAAHLLAATRLDEVFGQ